MPADRDDAACTGAFNERNRGKWQAVVPRALWGFARGRRTG
jgi:hypothetical protein